MAITDTSIRVYNLPESLKYPVRVIASYVTKGQKVSPSDRLYSLLDADDNQFHLEFTEAGTVVEKPVPVGSVFEQPLPVAYIHCDEDAVTASEATQDSQIDSSNNAPEQQQKTIEELIAELDETARYKLWDDYRLSVEKHLRSHGVPFEDAMRHAGDFYVKQRWQTLNLPVNYQESGEQAGKTSPAKEAPRPSTQATEEKKPAKTAVEVIEALDEVAKGKTWVDYNLTVERHLKANGFLSMQAQKLAGEDRVKQRWQSLNETASSPSGSSPLPETPKVNEARSGSTSPASEARRVANMAGDGVNAPPTANNYFTFILAVFSGAVATAIYAFLAKIIPLFFYRGAYPVSVCMDCNYAWIHASSRRQAFQNRDLHLRGNRQFSGCLVCQFLDDLESG